MILVRPSLFVCLPKGYPNGSSFRSGALQIRVGDRDTLTEYRANTIHPHLMLMPIEEVAPQ